MKKDEILYGLDHWERLELDIESVVERVFDDYCHKAGEGFDSIAARIPWPIKIIVYKRAQLGEKDAQSIADTVLENTLENLDDEYSDPDGDPAEATEAMKAAALAFGRIVVAGYIPWMCVRTGEVIEYTHEDAEREEKKSQEALMAKEAKR